MAGTRRSHAVVHASVLVLQNPGLAASRSKAIKEARLVERKVVYFGCQQLGQGIRVGADTCPKADYPPLTAREQELL